ncbi:cytochrome P450 [Cognatishimia activa]|uniref:Epi-isozizaene 5-monooxygenase/(E)-beta-farnesene synthase n=1 Tax=Cognatishimia activa TaxID=1715691 RepID=A0A0P1INZ2_9RHOB|nr:cytochrome P450 [Cognatishimia activa]CUJ26499.1 Epi-isozizaene 5-monooxygenase/(E)-beta-farnesene synthase [Cognatishimia activa]CUK25305.1 Epi-isozizaene 5-monooxygenase/(E)-beta-farnesene synthase [Cognatishimia activa]
MTRLPPKPTPRPPRVSLRRYAKLFRQDILSAQPARLYKAWMAEFKTPFFRSYLVNQPDLVKTVLKDRPEDFPKSGRVAEGLRPLLGNSLFVTNGEVWKKQRRIVDPAFEGGRLRDTFPAMWAASESAVARLSKRVGQDIEIESETSHAAADVIFRTLFSIPIEHEIASKVFAQFKDYQRSQPLFNVAALIPLPRWMPRFHKRSTKSAAASIRALIAELTQTRMAEIEAGTAPDDLATKIMTTRDPETGDSFSAEEMVDQVAIFFLAGHETSASSLAWTLYLLALYPEWQEKVAEEAQVLTEEDFGLVRQLKLSRDVFRESLRLYPPVPMMVRESKCPVQFRDRDVKAGSQVVLSPWHLHRHERLWDNPDGFDPSRWATENGKQCMREAYIPFSAGPRVCTGAGFAMVEGPLLLSMILRDFRIDAVAGREPVPVAHLTVRSKDGIWLRLSPRT